MEAGSAVARTSSRAARTCAADAAPSGIHTYGKKRRDPDCFVREGGLGLGAQEGGDGTVAALLFTHGFCSRVLFTREKKARVSLGCPPPLAFIAPGRSLRWAPLGPHLGRPFWA